MRKSFLILVLCFGFVTTHAQNRNVNRANIYLDSKEYVKAKESIDAAVVHEKTMDDAKTWFTKGKVYSTIATAEDKAIRDLDNNAFEEALNAYEKAMDLEKKKDSPGFVLAKQAIDDLWRVKVNAGASNYEAGNYDLALEDFQKALKAKPTDTLATFYAGVAAQNAGDMDQAVEYFYEYEKIGNADEQVYNLLVTYEMSKKNDEKAMEVIKKAMEKFPNNVDFAKNKYQILLKQGNTEEAIQGLQDAVRAEPNNPDLYYNMGALQEELKNQEAAIEAYKKAIEVDPKHKNANFNLAVIYYNRAADIIRESNALGISAADQKKAKELNKKAAEKFKEALPYIENAQNLMPDDRSLVQILMVAYDRTGAYKKADAMEKKLKSLPEEK